MKTAIVFPGQGSQSLEMLSDIAKAYPQVQETFNEAFSVLGFDLWQLTQTGPLDKLNSTEHTQPAILTASYALWKILNVTPDYLAGHSLGEYTALVASDALTFTDAVKLVAARGKYMQEAVPENGAMAAILGLDNKKVLAICHDISQQTNEIVSAANFNSIGQIVIAGYASAVERAIDVSKSQGAKIAVMLPVSVPSHCELMAPAAERLAELIKHIEIRVPKIPVVNNVDVRIYDSVESIRDGLTRQLTSPVRWVETIELLAKLNVHKIIECGPGKVLTGLNKRINKDLVLAHTGDLANLNVLLENT